MVVDGTDAEAKGGSAASGEDGSTGSWFVLDDAQETSHGPYNLTELRMQSRSGELRPTQLVSRDGEPWVPVLQTPAHHSRHNTPDNIDPEPDSATAGDEDDDEDNPIHFVRVGSRYTWETLTEGFLLKKARGRSTFGRKYVCAAPCTLSCNVCS